MSKSFREWNVDQVWLLPPSIDDFVPADHVAHFLRDTVRTALDLGLIYRSSRFEPSASHRCSIPRRSIMPRDSTRCRTTESYPPESFRRSDETVGRFTYRCGCPKRNH